MSSLNELLAQRAALEKQIIDATREEKSAAVAQVRALMAEHGLSMADLRSKASASPRRASGSVSTGKVAAKYRNSATGQTWSGRGLQPNWLKAAVTGGRSLADFAV